MKPNIKEFEGFRAKEVVEDSLSSNSVSACAPARLCDTFLLPNGLLFTAKDGTWREDDGSWREDDGSRRADDGTPSTARRTRSADDGPRSGGDGT